MQKFGPDRLWKKYHSHYKKVCDNLNLEPSPVIFLAYEKDSQGVLRSVGVRPLVRQLAEKKW